MMRYKLLGQSGLRVSELCLGTMSFGEAWGFGADEKEAHRILGAFAEVGGTFIDTANKYHEGQSEEIVGDFLGPGRDRFVVATKYTLAMDPADPNAAGNSRKNLRRSVEASMRRLRTDYLDLLWVHAWDYTTPVAEAYDLSVCAWAPMGAGILTGKYTRGAGAVPPDSRRAAANRARLTERNLAIAAEVDAVADQLGASSAQVALAWVRQRDRRLIPIVGVRTLEQLTDVLGCLELELAAEPLARLDEVSRIELGFPYELLAGPQGQMVYGDLEPQIDLPSTAPYRRQAIG
jgi:aryl-alcohol dehydrogenase-like predicted oxidoreductase